MRRRHFLQAGGGLLASTALPLAASASPSPILPDAVDLSGAWSATVSPVSSPAQLPAEGRTATVPGCWEADGFSAREAGPVWYRRTVTLPPGAAQWRWWLECDGVAAHCQVWAGAQRLGEHTGVWDAFALPVPADLVEQGRFPLALSVNKPIHSDEVAGALYGFLPYVWGTWGGPWQAVRLRATGPVRIASVRSFAEPVQAAAPSTGSDPARLEVQIALAGAPVPVRCRIRLEHPDGSLAAHAVHSSRGGASATVALALPSVERWEMDHPVLYRLTIDVEAAGHLSDRQQRRVGFRDIRPDARPDARPDGSVILLNGSPVYLRGSLSWGYDQQRRIPNPEPAAVRRQFAQLRSLGYNMVKLCLWVPPAHVYDIADEMGMLLWQEMPLWAPQATDAFAGRVRQQYARIVEQRGDHPSIVVWTLGCELSKGLSSAFLGELYQQMKRDTRSHLVRDNSGSSETYDGPLPEHADFWDFHFYTNLPFYRPIVEAFAPRWRKPQPWLYGEFCDSDAFRDLPAVMAKEGKLPWWASTNADVNPQGVRWDMHILDQMDRLRSSQLLPRLEQLRRVGTLQAELIRKVTVEETRSFPFISGYTITGLVDTPISSAGMIDYFGQLRFDPQRWQRFNHDTVLFLEPYRARDWVHGGDRPRFRERWNAWAGHVVERQIGVSHYGPQQGRMQVRWQVADASGRVLASGETGPRDLQRGRCEAMGWIRFTAPALPHPERLELHATLQHGDEVLCRNDWPLFVYPGSQASPGSQPPAELCLFDPAGLWDDAKALAGYRPRRVTHSGEAPARGPVLATQWTPAWRAWAQQGGRMLLMAAQRGSGISLRPMPFWREALKLVEHQEAWGAFPHDGWTDLQFYGLANDFALNWPADEEWSGTQPVSLLTRVDARTYETACYAFTATPGRGRMLVTSLNLQGGQGDQPTGLDAATSFENIAGSFLLRQWIAWLQTH